MESLFKKTEPSPAKTEPSPAEKKAREATILLVHCMRQNFALTDDTKKKDFTVDQASIAKYEEDYQTLLSMYLDLSAEHKIIFNALPEKFIPYSDGTVMPFGKQFKELHVYKDGVNPIVTRSNY